jgi:hypothetical protein
VPSRRQRSISRSSFAAPTAAEAEHVGVIGLPGEDEIEMILQVLADARQVVHDLDARFPQVRRRADARQEQQLRRAERAAADDDLAARPDRALPPPCRYDRPTALRPSSSTFVARAPVTTFRLGRFITGCR